jgi:hypothetical protein
MADNARYVFRTSRHAHRSITRLFDFVHPTAISLWNLRWQVQGFLANVPDADSKILHSRFAAGSQIQSGSLKRATVDITWEKQLEAFASFILTNAIATFEDHVSSVCDLSGLAGNKSVEKALQFPSTGNTGGLNYALGKLGASAVSAGAITWDLKTARRIDEAGVESLLLCYRYFKELRNSLAHNGGRADQKLIDAQAGYQGAIVNNKIGKANAPNIFPVQSISDDARPTYRGVIGFTEVIMHLIATYDSLLARTRIFEKELLDVLKKNKSIWPTAEVAKARRFESIFDKNLFPKFAPTAALVAFLKNEGVIPMAAAI